MLPIPILFPKKVPSTQPLTFMQILKGFTPPWPPLAPDSTELIPFMGCLAVLHVLCLSWVNPTEEYLTYVCTFTHTHTHKSILPRHFYV